MGCTESASEFSIILFTRDGCARPSAQILSRAPLAVRRCCVRRLCWRLTRSGELNAGWLPNVCLRGARLSAVACVFAACSCAVSFYFVHIFQNRFRVLPKHFI